jgi:hypothetical protein
MDPAMPADAVVRQIKMTAHPMAPGTAVRAGAETEITTDADLYDPPHPSTGPPVRRAGPPMSTPTP